MGQSDGWSAGRSVGRSVSWSVGELVGGQLVGRWSVGWSVSWSVSHLIYYATTNLGRMNSWKIGGVDFDGFIRGKKDYNFVVVGAVVVVSFFFRERGGRRCKRGGTREVQHDEKGMAQRERGLNKRWVA